MRYLFGSFHSHLSNCVFSGHSLTATFICAANFTLCISVPKIASLLSSYLRAIGVIFQIEIIEMNVQILSVWNIDPINTKKVA